MAIDPNAFIRVAPQFVLNSNYFDAFRLGPGALRVALTVALALCAAHLVVSAVTRIVRPRG